MNKYYLRIEGVNLSNFLDDTSDLNTIRGGGLMLLNAVNDLKEEFGGKLRPISVGASSGLFEFKADDDGRHMREEVLKYLRLDGRKHATFVVDIIENPGDFITGKEMCVAENRFQQMRSPTVAVPAQNEDAKVNPCFLDRLRPGTESETFAGKTKPDFVSESVKKRREYGKAEKHKFYKRITGVESTYVNSFEEIAKTKDDSKGNLNGKMAVIYFDGNKFGNMQKRLCKDEDSQKRFDEAVQGNRRDFLAAAITKMKADPQWQNDGKLRFETLLWGGDEMLFVLPAWKGWQFISDFYDFSRGWDFAGENLNHSGGMVFCHHNAPIGRVKSLAMELADDVKERIIPNQNYFAYEVLESFDHIGRNMEDYRLSRTPMAVRDTIGINGLILDGRLIGQVGDLFSGLRKSIPRRRLYRIASALISGWETSDIENEVRDLLAELDDDSIENLLKISPLLNGPNNPTRENANKLMTAEPMIWVHLNNLWDYLV